MSTDTPQADNVYSHDFLQGDDMVTRTQPKAAPAVGRKRVYATNAEKRAAYLERHNVCQLNVLIGCEAMEMLDAYVQRQKRDVDPALTKGQVLERLIRSQLLRKR